MSKKKPNNYVAPLVIAGVTIGFLTAGYKLAFGKKSPDPQVPQSVTKAQAEPADTD